MASQGLARTTSSILNSLRKAQCLTPSMNLRSLEVLRGRYYHLQRPPNEASDDALVPPGRRKSWVAERKHLPLLDDGEKVRGQRSTSSAEGAPKAKKEDKIGQGEQEGMNAFLNGTGVPISCPSSAMEASLNTVLLFRHPSMFKPSTGIRRMETMSTDSTRRSPLCGPSTPSEGPPKRPTTGGPRGRAESSPPKNKEPKKLRENLDIRAGTITTPFPNVKRVTTPKQSLNQTTSVTVRRSKLKTSPKRNSKHENVPKTNSKTTGEITLLTKLFSPSAEVRHTMSPAIPPKTIQHLMNDRVTNVNDKNIDKGQSVHNSPNSHTSNAHNSKFKPLQSTESKLFSLSANLQSTKPKTQHQGHGPSATHNTKPQVKQPNTQNSRMSTKATSEQVCAKVAPESQNVRKHAGSAGAVRTAKGHKTAKPSILPLLAPGFKQVKKLVGNRKHRSRVDTKDALKQNRLNNKSQSCADSKHRENNKLRNPLESSSKPDLRCSKVATPILPDVVKVKVPTLPRTVSTDSCVCHRKRSFSVMRGEPFHTDAVRRRKGKGADECEEEGKSASEDTKTQKMPKSKSAPSLDEVKPTGATQKGAVKLKSKKTVKSDTKKIKAQQMMSKVMASGKSKGELSEEKSECSAEKKPSKTELITRSGKRESSRKRKRPKTQETKSSSDIQMPGEKKRSPSKGLFGKKQQRALKSSKSSVRTKDAGDECPECPKQDCPTEEPTKEVEECEEEPPCRRRARERYGFQAKRSSHKKQKILSWMTWRKKKAEVTCPDIEDVRKQLNIFDEAVIQISKKVYINKEGLPPPPCVHKYKHLEMETLRIKRSETLAYPKSTKCASAFLPMCSIEQSLEQSELTSEGISEKKRDPRGSVSSPKMRSGSITIQITNTHLREGSADKFRDDTIDSNISDLHSFPSMKYSDNSFSELAICPPPPPMPLDPKIMLPRSKSEKEKKTQPPPQKATRDNKGPELLKITCTPSPESLDGFGPKFGKRFPPLPPGDPCGPKKVHKPLAVKCPLSHVCVHPMRPNEPVSRPSECRRPQQLTQEQILEQEEARAQEMAACRLASVQCDQSDCLVGTTAQVKAMCPPPKGVKVFSPWRRIFWFLALLLLPFLYFWWKKRRGKKVAESVCVADIDPPPLKVCEPVVVQPIPEHKTLPCSCTECEECVGRQVAAAAAAPPPEDPSLTQDETGGGSGAIPDTVPYPRETSLSSSDPSTTPTPTPPTPQPTSGKPENWLIPPTQFGTPNPDGFTPISEDLYLPEPPTISEPLSNNDADPVCLRMPKKNSGNDPKTTRPPQPSDPIAPECPKPQNTPSDPNPHATPPYPHSPQHQPPPPQSHAPTQDPTFHPYPPPVPPQPPIGASPQPTPPPPSPPPSPTPSNSPMFPDEDSSSLTETASEPAVVRRDKWPDKRTELVDKSEAEVQPRRTISMHHVGDVLREAMTADAWKRYKRNEAFRHEWVPGWGAGEEGLELVTTAKEESSVGEDDDTYVSSLVFSDDDAYEASVVYSKDVSFIVDDIDNASDQLSTDSLGISAEMENAFEIPDIPVWIDF